MKADVRTVSEESERLSARMGPRSACSKRSEFRRAACAHAPGTAAVVLLLTWVLFSAFNQAGLAQVPPTLPAELDYRATVLVRRFQSPGLREPWGELAAETLAAAIEAGGLARAVRPRYVATSERELEVGDVILDDMRRKDDGNWEPAGVDAFGRMTRRRGSKEAGLPASDYTINGTVSRIGETWWVRATVRDRPTGRALNSGSASGESDRGLLHATRAVAANLEAAYRSQVLERRAEAILRSVRAGVLPRQEAIRRLEELHGRWPVELAPAAVRLLLIAEERPLDGKSVIAWATKLRKRLPSAGAAGTRFVIRLNLDPYSLVAREYEIQGKLEDAARAHRDAVAVMPVGRFSHLVQLARLEKALGRTEEAAAAYRAALRLKPSDPEVQRGLELLTKESSEDKTQAPPEEGSVAVPEAR